MIVATSSSSTSETAFGLSPSPLLEIPHTGKTKSPAFVIFGCQPTTSMASLKPGRQLSRRNGSRPKRKSRISLTIELSGNSSNMKRVAIGRVCASILALFGCSDLCRNTILQGAPSPDGALIATVFTPDCGATTVQVYLVRGAIKCRMQATSFAVIDLETLP